MEFLTFKIFISPVALIAFYYMGAILMPLFGWFFARWIMKKIALLERGYQESKELAWRLLSLKYRVLFVLLFIMMFLFMELLWRMMFEFLIAYMQIWDVLLHKQ